VVADLAGGDVEWLEEPGADDVVVVLAVDEVVVVDGDPLEHEASSVAAAANTKTDSARRIGDNLGICRA
jgi:hypothetical protein